MYDYDTNTNELWETETITHKGKLCGIDVSAANTDAEYENRYYSDYSY